MDELSTTRIPIESFDTAAANAAADVLRRARLQPEIQSRHRDVPQAEGTAEVVLSVPAFQAVQAREILAAWRPDSAGAVRRVAEHRGPLASGVSWEAIAAGIVMVIFFVTRPAMESSSTPFLLRRTAFEHIADFVLLAAAAGLGLSSLRWRNKHGRLAGAIVLIVASLLLVDWLHLLLTWPARRWG